MVDYLCDNTIINCLNNIVNVLKNLSISLENLTSFKPQILVPNKQHTLSKKTIPYNGLSLFTGAGIGEYYIKEFVNIQVANELLSDRAKVYEHFYPNTVMIQGDIKDKFVYDTIILESKKYNIDFIIATPPCQSKVLV
jgi:hypothetical protein